MPSRYGTSGPATTCSCPLSRTQSSSGDKLTAGIAGIAGITGKATPFTDLKPTLKRIKRRLKLVYPGLQALLLDKEPLPACDVKTASLLSLRTTSPNSAWTALGVHIAALATSIMVHPASPRGAHECPWDNGEIWRELRSKISKDKRYQKMLTPLVSFGRHFVFEFAWIYTIDFALITTSLPPQATRKQSPQLPWRVC